MPGVAEKRDPSASETAGRVVVEGPELPIVRRPEHLLEERAGPGEARLELLRIARHRPAFDGIPPAVDGDDVDLPARRDRVVHDVARGTEPEAGLVAGDFGRRLLAGDGGAPRHIASIGRKRPVPERAADLGPEAVGADDGVEGGRLGLTARSHEGHGRPMLFARRLLRRAAHQEPDGGVRADGIEQDRLKVGPMQHPGRSAETVAHEAPERYRPDGLSGLDRTHDHPTRLGRDPPQGGGETELREDAAGIGRKLDAGADLGETAAAFDERYGMSAPREAQGGRQSADARSGDRDGERVH